MRQLSLKSLFLLVGVAAVTVWSWTLVHSREWQTYLLASFLTSLGVAFTLGHFRVGILPTVVIAYLALAAPIIGLELSDSWPRKQSVVVRAAR